MADLTEQTPEYPAIKFHLNSFITFWVMLLANRWTDKQTLQQTNAIKINYYMKTLQVAFLLLFNYLDSLPKLYCYQKHKG